MGKEVNGFDKENYIEVYEFIYPSTEYLSSLDDSFYSSDFQNPCLLKGPSTFHCHLEISSWHRLFWYGKILLPIYKGLMLTEAMNLVE